MRLRLCGSMCLLALVPAVASAQSLDVHGALKALPGESASSIVFTAQHVSRQRGTEPQGRAEAAAPTTAGVSQSLALLWTVSAVCGAMGNACTVTPPSPLPLTLSGAEAWRAAACRPEDACASRWQSFYPGISTQPAK